MRAPPLCSMATRTRVRCVRVLLVPPPPPPALAGTLAAIRAPPALILARPSRQPHTGAAGEFFWTFNVTEVVNMTAAKVSEQQQRRHRPQAAFRAKHRLPLLLCARPLLALTPAPCLPRRRWCLAPPRPRRRRWWCRSTRRRSWAAP